MERDVSDLAGGITASGGILGIRREPTGAEKKGLLYKEILDVKVKKSGNKMRTDQYHTEFGMARNIKRNPRICPLQVKRSETSVH